MNSINGKRTNTASKTKESSYTTANMKRVTSNVGTIFRRNFHIEFYFSVLTNYFTGFTAEILFTAMFALSDCGLRQTTSDVISFEMSGFP